MSHDELSSACTFSGCTESIIHRTVLATVDQLSAHADVSIALLEALDFPLEEILTAVVPFGIERVEMTVAEHRLSIAISLDAPIEAFDRPLGGSSGVVASFFDVRVSDDARELTLVGDLD